VRKNEIVLRRQRTTVGWSYVQDALLEYRKHHLVGAWNRVEYLGYPLMALRAHNGQTRTLGGLEILSPSVRSALDLPVNRPAHHSVLSGFAPKVEEQESASNYTFDLFSPGGV
jgi:hypothetical protein